MVLEILFIDDNLHPLTSQDVGRTNQQRESEFTTKFHCLVCAFHHPKLGIRNAFVLEQGREAASIFSQIKCFIGGPHDLDAVTLQLFGKFKRSLTSELDDDPFRLFVQNDVVNVLPEHGLEIEFVCCIKIRRHGLWIAVDHDGLIAAFFGGENAMNAAVIKFNALPNAVGTATQNDDFLFLRDHTFVGILLKCAVVIWSQRWKFCSTRINELVNPSDSLSVTARVHLRL